MLPKEHGAWAMLLTPYLVGTAASASQGWPSVLLLASVLLLFSSSRSLEVVLQGVRVNTGAGVKATATAASLGRQRTQSALLRLSAYLGLGGVAGLLLLILFHRWTLLGIGILAGTALATQPLLRHRRLDRSWPSRLISIAALTATGPAAYYAATGLLDRHAAAVWLLTFVYFGASVFYVRLIHQPPARQRPGPAEDHRTVAGRYLLAYLGTAALISAALTALGWLPPSAALAFVPLVAKVAWAWAKPDFRPSLRQIGFAEIGHTALFALLAIAVVISWP